MDKSDRIGRYAETYLDDYGFEAVLVRYRQRKCIDMLRRYRPRIIVEAGCGQDLLFDAAVIGGLEFDRWVIIEPSDTFFAVAGERAKSDDRLVAVKGFFEDRRTGISAACGQKADFVLFSGLFNEIEKPEALLIAAKSLMHEKSVIHVNTANAFSLHRRLGQAMGLIDSVHKLTDRNQRFDQFRVYDANSLSELVRQAGYSVIDSGGYFLKPFSHTQMESCGEVLTEDVLEGLYRLGEEHPEMATEIFVNAGLPS